MLLLGNLDLPEVIFIKVQTNQLRILKLDSKHLQCSIEIPINNIVAKSVHGCMGYDRTNRQTPRQTDKQ